MYSNYLIDFILLVIFQNLPFYYLVLTLICLFKVSQEKYFFSGNIYILMCKLINYTLGCPLFFINSITRSRRGVLHTTLHEKDCQWLDAGRWFALDTLFPPQINWPPVYNWNNVESGVKHHYPNTNHLITLHFTYQKFDSNIDHKTHKRKHRK